MLVCRFVFGDAESIDGDMQDIRIDEWHSSPWAVPRQSGEFFCACAALIGCLWVHGRFVDALLIRIVYISTFCFVAMIPLNNLGILSNGHIEVDKVLPVIVCCNRDIVGNAHGPVFNYLCLNSFPFVLLSYVPH